MYENELDSLRESLHALGERAARVANVKIAVLLPCYNEEAAIGAVVEQFRRALPHANIYVYDNNSTDATADVAKAAGAVVRRENLQGKGNVVRRMFADIEADIYVLADGDLTYDASAVDRLIAPLLNADVDMVVGVRASDAGDAYRRGHRFGNRLFNSVVRSLFGARFTDILSGYRAFSRRFVKSFPAASSGFEIETELSIHALELRLRTAELALSYGARPENSSSKLSTYKDGFKILMMIARMFRALKPTKFYGGIAALFFAAGLTLGAPILWTFLQTGLVPRLPTAILAASLMQLGCISFVCGLIISAVGEMRKDFKRLRYLELRAPGALAQRQSPQSDVTRPSADHAA